MSYCDFEGDTAIIRNTKRVPRGSFYRLQLSGFTSAYGFGKSRRPRSVKSPKGLSRWYFFILSTLPDPLRCRNMSRDIKTVGRTRLWCKGFEPAAMSSPIQNEAGEFVWKKNGEGRAPWRFISIPTTCALA